MRVNGRSFACAWVLAFAGSVVIGCGTAANKPPPPSSTGHPDTATDMGGSDCCACNGGVCPAMSSSAELVDFAVPSPDGTLELRFHRGAGDQDLVVDTVRIADQRVVAREHVDFSDPANHTREHLKLVANRIARVAVTAGAPLPVTPGRQPAAKGPPSAHPEDAAGCAWSWVTVLGDLTLTGLILAEIYFTIQCAAMLAPGVSRAAVTALQTVIQQFWKEAVHLIKGAFAAYKAAKYVVAATLLALFLDELDHIRERINQLSELLSECGHKAYDLTIGNALNGLSTMASDVRTLMANCGGTPMYTGQCHTGNGCDTTPCNAPQVCNNYCFCVTPSFPSGCSNNDDSYCLNSWCNDQGQCVAPQPNGSGCNRDAQCSSGHCDQSIGQCSTSNCKCKISNANGSAIYCVNTGGECGYYSGGGNTAVLIGCTTCP